MRAIDLSGQRFGRLIAVSLTGTSNNGGRVWSCVCDCGNTTNVAAGYLRYGNTTSCGCAQKEWARDRCLSLTKYSKDEKRLTIIRKTMLARCYNEKNISYRFYGKKGIRVCDEWKTSIDSFIQWALNNGYKAGLSIDRTNNGGDYSPTNCAWISLRENVKKEKPKYLFEGKHKTIPEISAITGIRVTTIHYRLSNGWEFNDAVTRYAMPSNRRYMK